MSVANDATATTAARQLLRDLVAIPSVSGEERDCAEHLLGFFEDHGRDAWIDEVGNVRAPADDAVLLTSHVDTVPGDLPVEVAPADGERIRGCDGVDDGNDGAGVDGINGGAGVDDGNDGAGVDGINGGVGDDGEPGSSDPHRREESDPALWGRGSVDAKGSLAAMAVAAVRTGVSFVGVVGEESDSRGARHLVADREQPHAVVNGEPSGWDAITLGYRGFLAGTYRVETPVAHTSRPEPNAIQRAMAWWTAVEAAVRDESGTDGSGDASVFDRMTAKPVATTGGTTEDGLSVEATVDFQVRVPPGTTLEAARDVVEGCLDGPTPDGAEAAGPRVAHTGDRIDWNDDAAVPPWIQSPRNPVARAFRAAIRREGGDPGMLRKTGTADANLYAAAWDCPVVTYGPGDSALDHAPDEHLPLSEFDRAVSVLEAVAEDLT